MKHPLDKFAYCPVCGSKHFEINNFKSKQCQDCGFTYYANPSAATAALIINPRNELLVVRRAKEPAKGTLDLPGGFVDMNETVEEGMCREIKEETGLEVSDIRYLFSLPNLYMYSGMGIHTIDMIYWVPLDCEHIDIQASDDAAEAIWIPINKVNPADFGLTSIRHAVEKFLSETLRKQKILYNNKV
jgi:ADP-ribose pyrophosphatase YjhB (NUDIX family)